MRAADELGMVPDMVDAQVVPADGAWPEPQLLCGLLPDLLPDLLLVRLELVEDLVQHTPGLPDNIAALPGPLLYLLHVAFECLGHLRPGDRVGMVLEALYHRPPDESGSQGVPLDVFPRYELLDNLVPRALRPQSEFFHPLDEPALREPRRGLGLLLLHPDLAEREDLPLLELRQQVLRGGTERVDLPPSGLGNLAAGDRVGFASGREHDLHRLPAGVRR